MCVFININFKLIINKIVFSLLFSIFIKQCHILRTINCSIQLSVLKIMKKREFSWLINSINVLSLFLKMINHFKHVFIFNVWKEIQTFTKNEQIYNSITTIIKNSLLYHLTQSWQNWFADLKINECCAYYNKHFNNFKKMITHYEICLKKHVSHTEAKHIMKTRI